MDTSERRAEILNLIKSADSPMSGSALSKVFGVSRQVIVQDIAILKAEHHDILSTNKGYIYNASPGFSRRLKELHSEESLEDEFNLIVDNGGMIVDVLVNHKLYGHMRAELNISSRRGVEEFVHRMQSGKSKPLERITSGYHYHTIKADSEETLDIIERLLDERGYLVRG